MSSTRSQRRLRRTKGSLDLAVEARSLRPCRPATSTCPSSRRCPCRRRDVVGERIAVVCLLRARCALLSDVDREHDPPDVRATFLVFRARRLFAEASTEIRQVFFERGRRFRRAIRRIRRKSVIDLIRPGNLVRLSVVSSGRNRSHGFRPMALLHGRGDPAALLSSISRIITTLDFRRPVARPGRIGCSLFVSPSRRRARGLRFPPFVSTDAP